LSDLPDLMSFEHVLWTLMMNSDSSCGFQLYDHYYLLLVIQTLVHSSKQIYWHSIK